MRQINRFILLLILPLGIGAGLYAQQVYTLQSGTAKFNVIAPASELTASNDSLIGSLNIGTGAISFKVFVAGFHFVTPYMPEMMNASASRRFQTYYFDSKTYPEATFQGYSEALKTVDLSQNKQYVINSSGIMTMHGISKEISVSGSIEVKGGKVYVHSEFNIDPRDYKVRIPESINRFYMKEVKITIDAQMKK